jgi:hypothetical protein
MRSKERRKTSQGHHEEAEEDRERERAEKNRQKHIKYIDWTGCVDI